MPGYDHFRDDLVHTHRRGEMAGACIGDAHHIKGRLDTSVLSVLSVQGDKDNIRRPAHLEDMQTEQGRTLPFSGPSYRVQIRSRPVEGVLRNGGKIFKKNFRIKSGL